MLTESQLEWQKRIAEFPGATALIQPVKYRQLLKSIRAYLGDSVQRAEA
jgi:hypothetical protein